MATASVAALLIAAGTHGAGAAGAISDVGVSVDSVLNSAAIDFVLIQNSTVSGNVTNAASGTITPQPGVGINVINSTVGGTISNAGAITQGNVGIFVNANSAVAGGIINSGKLVGTDGIVVFNVSSFLGGITNSGTISTAGTNGIFVLSVSSFSGGITNSGTISTTGGRGIGVRGSPAQLSVTSTFTGGITNSGTISSGNGIAAFDVLSFSGPIANSGTIFAAGTAGILVNTVSNFASGVINSGTISAANNGIFAFGDSDFAAGIANSGTITAANDGISVVRVSDFAEGIANSGTITAGQCGIVIVNVSNFAGGVVNSGAISAQNAIVVGAGLSSQALATLSSFSGGISNSGKISAGNDGIVVGASVPVSVPVTIATFAGGINNSGTISVGNDAIVIGGFSPPNNSLTISTFAGGINNSGTISAGVNGILVGPDVTNPNVPVAVSAFAGGISNSKSGTISAGFNGIWVGGFAVASASLISTFAGGISNAGTILATNGIWVGGTAQIRGSVTISTFAGGVSNSGTISVSGNGIRIGGNATANSSVTVSTFAGGISNSGSISAGSAGIIVGARQFSGNVANSGTIVGKSGIVVASGMSFAGGAIINSGMVSASGVAIDASGAASAVTIDQTAGLIAGAIRLSPNADVLNITGGTIAGNITGQGSANTINFALGGGALTYGPAFGFTGINQVNVSSGTVILDGANSAAGFVVTGGNLKVGDAANPGALLTGAVDVDGGILSGHGTVVGAVTVGSGGTLAPGGSIGTLSVSGSVAFGPGSTYAVELTSMASSRLTVTGTPGTANISGASVTATSPGGLGPIAGGTFTILSASGGRAGTFTGLAVTAPVGNITSTSTLSLSYDADDVFLTVGRGSNLLTLPGGANGAQRSIVRAIDSAIVAGSSVPAGFQSLVPLSTPSLLGALNQLSGEVAGSFPHAAFQAGGAFLDLLLDPLVDGRGGSAVFGGGIGHGGGFGAIGFAPRRPSSDAFASVLEAPPSALPVNTPQFQLWGAAYGGSGSVNGDPAAGTHDTTSQVYGFAAGVDDRVSPDSTLGFALAGGGTQWSLDQGFGSGRSDMFQAGAFGSTHWGAAYLAGALAYSFHDVTTNRTVALAGTDQLQASFQAHALGERIEGGYRVATPWLAVTPYAGVQAQTLFLPAYGEAATAGSGQFALSYTAQNLTTTRTELGAWLDRSWLADAGALVTLYGRAAWAHDFGNMTSVSALFETLPGSDFVVNGAKPAPDGALLTAGVQLKLTSGWSFQAKLDGELSSTKSLYSGLAVIRRQW